MCKHAKASKNSKKKTGQKNIVFYLHPLFGCCLRCFWYDLCQLCTPLAREDFLSMPAASVMTTNTKV